MTFGWVLSYLLFRILVRGLCGHDINNDDMAWYMLLHWYLLILNTQPTYVQYGSSVKHCLWQSSRIHRTIVIYITLITTQLWINVNGCETYWEQLRSITWSKCDFSALPEHTPCFIFNIMLCYVSKDTEKVMWYRDKVMTMFIFC